MPSIPVPYEPDECQAHRDAEQRAHDRLSFGGEHDLLVGAESPREPEPLHVMVTIGALLLLALLVLSFAEVA